MRPTSPTLLGTTLAAALLAARANAEVVDTREIEQAIPVSASAPLVVIVKNVTGSVRLTGHDRDSVELHATETVRGDLRADIDRARAELSLVTEQEPGRIAFRVRRIGDDQDCDCAFRQWDGYRVAYDIEVRVPRAAAVELATVNDGEIVAEGVYGAFTLSNVNGAVPLTGARSGGSINTVNGDVTVTFERVPADATSFKTVNGSLDVTYPPTLAANLEFKTMNGDVYTDFDVVTLDAPATVERDNGRGLFRMRSNRNSAFRVGAGGTRHSFHTLNGSIYVRKAKS